MSINKTDLGPNSAILEFTANETLVNVLAAIDAYVTTHGWELWDAAAPQGATVGRVYRALQKGSATAYKYVGISLSGPNIALRTYESWNAATHVGANEGTYYTIGGGAPASLPYSAHQIGTADAAILLFVNPLWLGLRTRSSTMQYGYMYGAFEIRKDFGEADSIPTNIFMTTATTTNAPQANNGGYCAYGATRAANSAAVTSAASQVSNIMTAYGAPQINYTTHASRFADILPTNVPMCALTMTAVEMAAFNLPKVLVPRGEILGIKLAAGSSAWNDMDVAELPLDDDYQQSPTGVMTQHHYMTSGGQRYLLPI